MIGIITYVCFGAAFRGGIAAAENSAYLIDARNLTGMVYPCKDRSFFSIYHSFPIVRTVYEVKIMCPIPNTKVVGIVVVSSHMDCLVASRLKLHVNPEYEGGMDGARVIVERFNGGDWQMVTAADAAGAGV